MLCEVIYQPPPLLLLLLSASHQHPRYNPGVWKNHKASSIEGHLGGSREAESGSRRCSSEASAHLPLRGWSEAPLSVWFWAVTTVQCLHLRRKKFRTAFSLPPLKACQKVWDNPPVGAVYQSLWSNVIDTISMTSSSRYPFSFSFIPTSVSTFLSERASTFKHVDSGARVISMIVVLVW